MPLDTPGFDFASRDYANIRRDLLLRAERMVPEWTDRDPSDFTMLLVDLWAYMGDILHYYIDRTAGEAFIETATQRESVLALANLFDYAPRTRTPARATVYVSNSSGSSVSLPAGTVFVGEGESENLEFYSSATTTIPSSQTVAVTCYEGVQYVDEVLTSAATGRIGQVYTIPNAKVIPSSVRVYVYEDGENPREWMMVASVNSATSDVSAFSTYVTTEGYTAVMFGNRLSGRVPPAGAKITVSYNITNGDKGNIGSNKIRAFKASQVTGLSVNSSSAAGGGSSGESLESIKRSIKATIQTQSRAVTLQDYVDLALQMDGVYKAVAKYEPSAAGASAGGSVSVYTIPYVADYHNYYANNHGSASTTVDPITVSPTTAYIVQLTLQAMSMLGVTVVLPTTVTVKPKTLNISVYVTAGYIASYVHRNVENAINGFFSIETAEFGKAIRIGDLYRLIHNIEGVDYATITMTGADPALNQIACRGPMQITTYGGITTGM